MNISNDTLLDTVFVDFDEFGEYDDNFDDEYFDHLV